MLLYGGSPHGKKIVSAGGYGTAKVWDWDGKRAKEILQLAGHRQAIWSAVFFPDNQTVVTSSADGTAKLWDTTIHEPRVLTHNAAVSSVVFVRDGERIVSVSHDGIARLWNVATGQIEREFSGDSGKLLSVAVSPDGDWIVTGGEDGTAQMWDLARSQPRFAWPLEHNASVTAVRVSPDGHGSARAVRIGR